MVLSKRERYAAAATAAALAVVGVYSLVLEPLWAQNQDLDARVANVRLQLADDNRAISSGRRADAQWKKMISAGLSADASQAEGQVPHSVLDWAQDAGITLSSLKAERVEKGKDFHKITLRASAAGGMSQIGRFLWRIQTATIPVRITELQIDSSRREGSDDLTLRLGLATIYRAPDAEKPAKSAVAREEQP